MIRSDSTTPSQRPLLDDMQSIAVSSAPPSIAADEQELGCLHRGITALGRVLNRRRRTDGPAWKAHYTRQMSSVSLMSAAHIRPSAAAAARLAEAVPPQILTRTQADVHATTTIATQTVSPAQAETPPLTQSDKRLQEYRTLVAERELLISQMDRLIARLPASAATAVQSWLDSQNAINVLQGPAQLDAAEHRLGDVVDDRAMRLIKRSHASVVALKPLLEQSPIDVPELLSAREAYPARMEALLPSAVQSGYFEDLMDRLAEAKTHAELAHWQQATEHLLKTVEQSNALIPQVNERRLQARDDLRLTRMRTCGDLLPEHLAQMVALATHRHDRGQLAMTDAVGGALAAQVFLTRAQMMVDEASRVEQFHRSAPGLPKTFEAFLGASEQLTPIELRKARAFHAEALKRGMTAYEVMTTTRLFVNLIKGGMDDQEASGLARLFRQEGTACADDLVAVAHALKGQSPETLRHLDERRLRIHVCCDRLTDALPFCIGKTYRPVPMVPAVEANAPGAEGVRFWEDEVLHTQKSLIDAQMFVAVQQKSPAAEPALAAIDDGATQSTTAGGSSTRWREVPEGCRAAFEALAQWLSTQPAR